MSNQECGRSKIKLLHNFIGCFVMGEPNPATTRLMKVSKKKSSVLDPSPLFVDKPGVLGGFSTVPLQGLSAVAKALEFREKPVLPFTD